MFFLGSFLHLSCFSLLTTKNPGVFSEDLSICLETVICNVCIVLDSEQICYTTEVFITDNDKTDSHIFSVVLLFYRLFSICYSVKIVYYYNQFRINLNAITIIILYSHKRSERYRVHVRQQWGYCGGAERWERWPEEAYNRKTLAFFLRAVNRLLIIIEIHYSEQRHFKY